MPRTNKLGTHKTTVRQDVNGTLRVTYHSTDIVIAEYSGFGKITLNTGGYYTYTTKLRMNQAANQFNLPYSVFQKNGTWYALDHRTGITHQFKNNFVILPSEAQTKGHNDEATTTTNI